MATYDATRLYRLTELREAQKITLEQMAKYCGLSGTRGRESVSRWEQGASKPRPARRPKFIEYLSLHLKLESDRLLEVWDILVEEWDWEPLTQQELQRLDHHPEQAETAAAGVPHRQPAPPKNEAPLALPSIQSWQFDTGSVVAAVAISADGEMVVAATMGKNVLALDKDGNRLWQAPVGNEAWRVAISTDGQTIVVGTGSTRPWDLAGRGLYCFDSNGRLRWPEELKASVWGLSISADGNTVAVGTSGKQLILFDGAGNRLWQQDVPGFGPYALVWSTAVAANGQYVVAGAADKRLRLFNRNGVQLIEHRVEADVFTVAISADGETIAAGDGANWVYLFNRQGGVIRQERLGDKVWAVALSADGSRLLVGAGEKDLHLHLYDQNKQSPLLRYVGGSVSSLAINDSGQYLVAGTRSGSIYIFRDDGEVLYQHQAAKSVRDVAISARGDYVVAGSEDGVIYGFRWGP